MIRFSICGAASYACGELLRLMVNHPETQVAHLADSFAAGRRIQDEHPALMGFYDQEILPLNDETIAQIVEDSDVVFTAVDAGTVCGIAEKVLAGGKKFIDFGADIRFRDAKVWEKWYHLDHPNYEMTKEAVYCIPEIQRDLAKGKSLISNPGCYPTATTLGLYPALKEGLTDAIWVYYGWGGINAQVEGLDFDYFYFKDIDPVFDYYTPVIIANDDFLAEDPDTAKAFLSAVAQGYEYAIDHPEEAAQILMDGDTTGALAGMEDLIVASQKWMADQYKAEVEQWGYIDPARWNAFYNWLSEKDLVDIAIPENTGFSNDYLAP